jgi:hypothetical protein
VEIFIITVEYYQMIGERENSLIMINAMEEIMKKEGIWLEKSRL